MSANKKMLMLGTSKLSCEMVRYAKSLGVYTIVTDYLPPEKSIAKLLADEFWMTDTSKIDILERRCKEEDVNAVICGISEFNLEVCMELCKRLGLQCYCTPEAWHYSRDKYDFKNLCKSVGAPVAEDYYFSENPLESEISVVDFPVVVKPVDLSGNKGISFCFNREQLITAIQYAKSVSQSNKLVVERMLHGEEWYSSYVFSNGEVRFLGLCAMYSQPGEAKNSYTIISKFVQHSTSVY